MKIPLFEKYRPENFLDIKSQDLAVAKVKAYLTGFKANIIKKKAVILYGPTGTGKTTIAMVCAKENDFELFELIAILKDKTVANEIVGACSRFR